MHKRTVHSVAAALHSRVCVHCHGIAKICRVWIDSRFFTYLPCYADMSAKYPRFSGTGYVAFPVPRGAHREFHVIVELRPDVLNGLIVFSAGHPDARSDFFSLSLQRGRIELRCVIIIIITTISYSLARERRNTKHIETYMKRHTT